MAYSRRRTGERWEERGRETVVEEKGDEWSSGFRDEENLRFARNKRNLTWRPAHFLNGMFPLPLRDIICIVCGLRAKNRPSPPPPRSASFFFVPPIIRGKRSRAAMPSPPRCSRRCRSILRIANALCRVSYRVYLNGILYAVSTWRSLSIVRPRPLPSLSHSLSLAMTRV